MSHSKSSNLDPGIEKRTFVLKWISAIRPWIKVSVVFIVLCCFLSWLLILSGVKGKSIERGFRFRRKFCKTALSILGITYHNPVKTQEGVFLYVSNHRSMLDPLIQLAYLDAFIVSKSEVGRYPVLGRGAKETGIILVDRTDPASRRSALDAIAVKLKSGFPVLIYPEGTTYGGELTGEFRRGAFELASRNTIPIIPVMIEYPDPSYYWVNDSLLHYFETVFSSARKHNVIGKTSPALQQDQPDVLLQQTQAQINNMIQDTRLAFPAIKK